MEENLKIEDHVRIMVMKVITRKPNLEEAAATLGVSIRTLHRYKIKFNIQLAGDQYQIIPQK